MIWTPCKHERGGRHTRALGLLWWVGITRPGTSTRPSNSYCAVAVDRAMFNGHEQHPCDGLWYLSVEDTILQSYTGHTLLEMVNSGLDTVS